MTKLPGWKDLPVGAQIKEAGSSRHYKTGDWRSKRPVHDPAKCTNCLICWIYCPEGCIHFKDKKFDRIDLDYCKGCGICAAVCPAKEKAIRMEKETR